MIVRHLSALAMLAIAACASAQKPEPVPTPAPAPSHSSPPVAMPTTLLPGVGMSTAPPATDDTDDDVAGPVPACAKDEDCWSKTCCPATAPEQCVHASRARKCAIIDVSCKPSPMHYTCICAEGACKGRLAPP